MSVLAALATCISLLSSPGCGDGHEQSSPELHAAASQGGTSDRRANDLPRGLQAANTLRVRSASGKTIIDHPLQFGRPFVAGEIRGCPQVLLDGTTAAAQVDVKTRHPDGSVRFALVSAVLPTVPAAAEVTVSFTDAPCQNMAPLSRDEMLSPRFDFDARVSLNGGLSGTASARDMLSQEHFSLWTQGPVVTTAVVADHSGKKFDIGVDQHRSLRPIFEVQFWPTIAKTRVRVILEAADTEKVQNQNYDVEVNTGAATPKLVFYSAGVKHNFMSRWTRVFWIGGPPEAVDIDYGVAYLARTQALPNYDASVQLSAEAKSAILSAWAAAPKGLYQKGLWQMDMNVAGGRPDLGPYPRWMAAWLYDGSAALREVALGQADQAAAWPMHLREGSPGKFADRAGTLPALGKPVSGYARPTLAYASLGYSYTRKADRVNVVGERSTNGWLADNAHQPQPFFIPYILTGEHFYNEQLQFWAGYSLLDNPWGLYGEYCYSKNATPEYLGIGGQVRGHAWGFRMLSEAAWAAPESDAAAHTWLRSAVEDVVTRYEGMRGIVRDGNTLRPDWQWANSKGDCSKGALSSANPLRYWDLGNTAYGSNASVARYEAVWQYSFLMYSLNRAAELGLPASGLRDWLAPFFISAATHGGVTGYHLADYTIPVVDVQTGAFYQTWEAVNAEYKDYAGDTAWTPKSKANSTSVNNLAQGYATAALAALASTNGAPGSAAAWDTFAAPHYALWGWAADPKWAILPRNTSSIPATLPMPRPIQAQGVWMGSPEQGGAPPTAGSAPSAPIGSSAPVEDAQMPNDPPPQVPTTSALPAWLSSAKVFEWRPVPGSRLDQTDAWTGYKGAAGTLGKAGILAYSGGTVKARGSEFFIAGGGHLDYAGNEVFSIALGADSPKWVRRIDPSNPTPMNTSHYPDGRPSSRHTYRNLAYITPLDRLVFFGGAPWGDKPTNNTLVDTFDPSVNDYDPPGLIAAAPRPIGGPVGTGVSAHGDFYIHHTDGNLYRWEQRTNTWHHLGNKGSMQYDSPYAFDTKRNRLFRTPSGIHPARYYDMNDAGAPTTVSISGPAAESAVNGTSLVYDPVLDVFWLWKSKDTNLYRIDAETFSATVQPVSGPLPKVAYIDARHNIYGRFNYVPELRGLIFMLDHSTDVMFIRTAP